MYFQFIEKCLPSPAVEVTILRHKTIHSFIQPSSAPACSLQGHGGLEPILEVMGIRQGITRDVAPTHHRMHTAFTHTGTLTESLAIPVHFSKFMGSWGQTRMPEREPKNPRICKLYTQGARMGTQIPVPEENKTRKYLIYV